MAKKSRKKTGGRTQSRDKARARGSGAAARSGRGPARRPARKSHAAGRKQPRRRVKVKVEQAPFESMENPSRVSTGSGATPAEIGADLVAMFNRGEFKEIEEKWWSPAIVSVEGMGMAWSGREAVEGKNTAWMEANEIVGASAEGPYVGASGFAVKFRMRVRERATGKSTEMQEVGVYTVMDGKIVREEFMYGQGG